LIGAFYLSFSRKGLEMTPTSIMTFRLNSKDRQSLAEIARKLDTSQTQAIRLLIRGGIKDPLDELLTKEEIEALDKLATRERRDPLLQAALLIRQMLEVKGVLEITDPVLIISEGEEVNEQPK